MFHSVPFEVSAVRDSQRPSCPTKSPKRFSASPGLLKPRPINSLIRSCVAGRTNGSKARVPTGFDFDIRRQTSDVDKALGIHDCLFVEGGDSGGKRIDKSVKVSIRQRPIHVAVELGQVAWD